MQAFVNPSWRSRAAASTPPLWIFGWLILKQSGETNLRLKKTSVILVSHDRLVIKRIYDRVILFEAGRLREIGEPERVVNSYLELIQPPPTRQQNS